MTPENLLIILSSLLTGALGWFVRGALNDVKKLTAETNANHVNLSNYKTHVAENYATKHEVGGVENKFIHAVDRVHDRLDQIVELINEKSK